MAKGTDSEKYVVLSKVRAGLKREFSFAIKAHSEVCGGSLSRTRSNMNRNVVQVSEPSQNKRFRNSGPVEKDDILSEGNDGFVAGEIEIGDDAKKEIVSDNVRSVITPIQVKKWKAKFSSSKKFPSKLKDLLDSRILDGLHVKYVRGVRVRKLDDAEFWGVIKGDGIVCYCEICDGVKTVSPATFELHAGSSNKRPPEYIFLENGNSIRVVMNTFLNNPLENLEEAVHEVLGDFTMKKSKFCLNCRDVNVVSRLFCNFCVGSEDCQPSPTHTTETSNSCVSLEVKPRSPKPVVLPKSLPQGPKEPKGMKFNTSRDKNQGRLTKKDLRFHKLIIQDVLKEGTEVAYIAYGEKLLDGYVKRSGIFCFCCEAVVSPSQFEAHAGWGSRRKPYVSIFTKDGVSLHTLAISLLKQQGISTTYNDDLCSICKQGGNLLCCDGCPRTFHTECVPLLCIPSSFWYCRYCQNIMRKGRYVEHNANALAAGRIAGVDLEQITQRFIRIVKATEDDESGCALCREKDFTREFGPRTVIICDQCEKEYHIGCLKDHNMQNIEKLPEGNWYCCSDCDQIHTALQNLVACGEEHLSDSLLSLIKKKHEKKGLETESGLDIKWRVLNWKMIASEEIRPLLSQAVAIFHEQFDPIVDSDTGNDFIPTMIFGRTIKDQDFAGMYCAVLTVNQVVVCAGIFRVFGQEVAELPLVATNTNCQGQGYFQSLLSCIERVLGSLKVRRLVLPAAHQAESIWTGKFGFTKVDRDEIDNYMRCYRMMVFQGTSLLQKPVPAL
ncbi:uncharacterized protein [Cicer arietinum]|uniref:Uncharacterized protein LOC101496128 isoform X2 n=1 Tax=Cicer arietinum TaxID=3827 RepID=A0A1S2YKN5_CICAR|nr:uncharacterized protein LOC101496128 isoform X2 [Cicer arietinum]